MIPPRSLLVLLAWITLSVPRATADPKVDGNALLLPTYIFELQTPISAGFAFVVEEGAQRYALTAYHVFGPAGHRHPRAALLDVAQEVAQPVQGVGQVVLVGPGDVDREQPGIDPTLAQLGEVGLDRGPS